MAYYYLSTHKFSANGVGPYTWVDNSIKYISGVSFTNTFYCYRVSDKSSITINTSQSSADTSGNISVTLTTTPSGDVVCYAVYSCSGLIPAKTTHWLYHSQQLPYGYFRAGYPMLFLGNNAPVEYDGLVMPGPYINALEKSGLYENDKLSIYNSFAPDRYNEEGYFCKNLSLDYLRSNIPILNLSSHNFATIYGSSTSSTTFTIYKASWESLVINGRTYSNTQFDYDIIPDRLLLVLQAPGGGGGAGIQGCGGGAGMCLAVIINLNLGFTYNITIPSNGKGGTYQNYTGGSASPIKVSITGGSYTNYELISVPGGAGGKKGGSIAYGGDTLSIDYKFKSAPDNVGFTCAWYIARGDGGDGHGTKTSGDSTSISIKTLDSPAYQSYFSDYFVKTFSNSGGNPYDSDNDGGGGGGASCLGKGGYGGSGDRDSSYNNGQNGTYGSGGGGGGDYRGSAGTSSQTHGGDGGIGCVYIYY